MQTFRQNYHQLYPSTMLSNINSTSRGRSLTPPSLKHNSHLSSRHHLRTQDFYYQQPPPPLLPPHIYSDSNYYRTYGGDPYLIQRLPPPAFLSSNSPSSSSSSRAYRNTYSSSSSAGIDRYSTHMSNSSRHRRSRSRSRRRYGKKHTSPNKIRSRSFGRIRNCSSDNLISFLFPSR